MTGHCDEEQEHSRRSQETPRRRFASLPDDDPLPLQREQAENSDSDTSTREPTNPALSNLPDATNPQEKDHLPEPHSSQQERVPVVEDQEGSHTAVNRSQSPPSRREERSPARDGLENTTHRPSIPQQLQSAVVTGVSPNKGQELLAEYARLRRLPILSIDLNTYDGQLQYLAMMQDFASWMASNGGSIQRGNLGLEIPHLANPFNAIVTFVFESARIFETVGGDDFLTYKHIEVTMVLQVLYWPVSRICRIHEDISMGAVFGFDISRPIPTVRSQQSCKLPSIPAICLTQITVPRSSAPGA